MRQGFKGRLRFALSGLLTNWERLQPFSAICQLRQECRLCPTWDENDLIEVVIGAQQENARVEYKTSAALNFDDQTLLNKEGKSQRTLGQKHREEFILDVAAMANGEGGKIYTGVKADKDGFPLEIDEGFDTSKLNADGFEQILLNNINPPLEGLSIEPVEMKSKGNKKVCLCNSCAKSYSQRTSPDIGPSLSQKVRTHAASHGRQRSARRDETRD